MKKLLQLSIMVLAAGVIHAQTVHISTDYKQTCYWNTSTSSFDKCGDNSEYASMFTINESETIFTHTTNDIKSSYYVKDKEYKAAYDAYVYNVTSDVGNKYMFIVDLKNKLVKIMSATHTDASDDYLIKFSIKSSWKD